MKHYFTELLKTAVRSIVIWIFVGTMAYIVITEIPAPEWFIAAASTVLVFWFRNSNGDNGNK